MLLNAKWLGGELLPLTLHLLLSSLGSFESKHGELKSSPYGKIQVYKSIEAISMVP